MTPHQGIVKHFFEPGNIIAAIVPKDTLSRSFAQSASAHARRREIQCPSQSWSKALPATDSNPQPTPAPHPALRQLALQAAALMVVLSLAWPYFGLRNESLPWPATALAIGGVALLIASWTLQPWWWGLIHTLFSPLAWYISTLSIAPGWFLLAFILMLLV